MMCKVFQLNTERHDWNPHWEWILLCTNTVPLCVGPHSSHHLHIYICHQCCCVSITCYLTTPLFNRVFTACKSPPCSDKFHVETSYVALHKMSHENLVRCRLVTISQPLVYVSCSQRSFGMLPSSLSFLSDQLIYGFPAPGAPSFFGQPRLHATTLPLACGKLCGRAPQTLQFWRPSIHSYIRGVCR